MNDSLVCVGGMADGKRVRLHPGESCYVAREMKESPAYKMDKEARVSESVDVVDTEIYERVLFIEPDRSETQLLRPSDEREDPFFRDMLDGYSCRKTETAQLHDLIRELLDIAIMPFGYSPAKDHWPRIEAARRTMRRLGIVDA